MRRRRRFGAIAIAFLAVVAVLFFEIQTATFQSMAMRSLVASFEWKVLPGASPRVIFPRWGPFDERMGYTRIPEFRHRLEHRGFHVSRQAHVSKSLAAFAKWGVTPPQSDRSVAGLVIRARDGSVLFDASTRSFRFQRFEDIPPSIVSALALMEDHGIDPAAEGRSNPAVDWGRLGRAAVFSVGNKLGMGSTFQGGSTIAVQIEKYRHSRDGRTRNAMDKLQQIVSASLRVYGPGSPAREEQRAIVLDYLNTVPLGGAPGYGEVHGLGEGLRAWFGLDPAATFAAFDPGAGAAANARAWKHVLALLCAVRAPSRMLRVDHPDLERRLAFYQNRMVEQGQLDPGVARRMALTSLHYSREGRLPVMPAAQRDVVERVRMKLPALLGLKDLHELDGLDIDVETSYDASLQTRAFDLMKHLREPDSVAAWGLVGPHMLEQGDPSKVWYSLYLCERAPEGDLVSVVADDMDQPFDMNTGMRMQLGSTAKLRTMAHYFEIIERLQKELAPLGREALLERVRDARDPITRWTAEQLVADPELPLDSLLARSLDREYSASPGEVFFTGGGVHTFHNFDEEDDGRRPNLRDAFAHSTNLVFIRLMRDVVRWHIARLPYDAHEVLADTVGHMRYQMLSDAADEESKAVLHRTWRNLSAVPADSIPERLLGSRRSPQRLTMLYFAWHHAASADSLGAWLAARGVAVDSTVAGRLTRAYGGDHLTLRDYAYLLDLHPLEIWSGAQLLASPGLAWQDLLSRSHEARAQAQEWLFEPRNRRAQDLRLRIQIERDAFKAMAEDWKRLGFPFDHLVPSYATAIGSSADRPAALAELMGIIMNDGVRRSPVTIRKIRFAPGTPYETVLEPVADPGEQRMSQPVARTLRALMAEVVTHGTAQSLSTAFPDSMRARVPMGGKTGSGDNRFDVFARGGRKISSRAVNRTATFVFYVGDRYYGVLTAVVDGPASGGYTFTSALPVRIVRMLAPDLEQRAAADLPTPTDPKLTAAVHRDPARPAPATPAVPAAVPPGRRVTRTSPTIQSSNSVSPEAN